MPLDQFLERNAHRLFDVAWRVHMPREAVDLGTGVLRPADSGEPARAATQDHRYDRDRLDIVDRGRAAIETDLRREGRLQARLALAAFKTFEQPGFLAANIGASAAMQVEFKIPAGATGVFADQAGVIGLVDGGLEALCLVIKLAADIDIASVDTHADRGEQAAFDQLVRVVADDVPVLAGAWLTLIGIDAKIGRTVALLWHERPLEAGREPGAAAPAQSGFLDLLDDPVAPFEDQLLSTVPIAALLG